MSLSALLAFVMPKRSPSMRKRWPVLMLSCLLTLAGCRSPSCHADDDKAVRDAAAGFYAALNALFVGDVSPMKDVWSHAEDVTYMGPMGGFEVGWTKVLDVWEEQAALELGGKVEPSDVQVTVSRKLAVVSAVELGENTNAKGERQKVSIRATNVFRKERGAWKMIGHHTDLLPYLAK